MKPNALFRQRHTDQHFAIEDQYYCNYYCFYYLSLLYAPLLVYVAVAGVGRGTNRNGNRLVYILFILSGQTGRQAASMKPPRAGRFDGPHNADIFALSLLLLLLSVLGSRLGSLAGLATISLVVACE